MKIIMAFYCRECGTTDPSEMMGKASNKICKTCNARRMREYRNNPDTRQRSREINAASDLRNRAKRAKYQRDRLHLPEYRARRAVHYAVLTGKLIKPEHCQICGKETPSFNLHGHHPDYNKPLDVIWVCTNCHPELDQIRREIEALRSADADVGKRASRSIIGRVQNDLCLWKTINFDLKPAYTYVFEQPL